MANALKLINLFWCFLHIRQRDFWRIKNINRKWKLSFFFDNIKIGLVTFFIIFFSDKTCFRLLMSLCKHNANCEKSKNNFMRYITFENYSLVHSYYWILQLQFPDSDAASPSENCNTSGTTISLFVQYNGFFNQLCDIQETMTIESLLVCLKILFSSLYW